VNQQANQFPTARKARLFEFNRPISATSTITLALAAWVMFFGLWELAVLMRLTNEVLLPGPAKVLASFVKLFAEKEYLADIGMSLYRVITSFTLACLLAVPLGILMGTFRRVEAFFNPLVSAFRYLPAPSFIPLLLMWFGAGEGEKLALLFLGVVWFLITLISRRGVVPDHADHGLCQVDPGRFHQYRAHARRQPQTGIVDGYRTRHVAECADRDAANAGGQLDLPGDRRDRRRQLRHRRHDDARQAFRAHR
jgi:hypothetical protein